MLGKISLERSKTISNEEFSLDTMERQRIIFDELIDQRLSQVNDRLKFEEETRERERDVPCRVFK